MTKVNLWCFLNMYRGACVLSRTARKTQTELKGPQVSCCHAFVPLNDVTLSHKTLPDILDIFGSPCQRMFLRQCVCACVCMCVCVAKQTHWNRNQMVAALQQLFPSRPRLQCPWCFYFVYTDWEMMKLERLRRGDRNAAGWERRALGDTHR